MLTVRSLIEELGLRLVETNAAADTPVRWVHISELKDPTPWLSGGELLLTTGMQLTSDRAQRDYVRLLVGHGVAGLGFGTGLGHDEVPAGVLDEARSAGLPVFEVPYEMPFIAVTEKASARLINEQYEVLQRGISVHKRLEELVLAERGLDALVQAIAKAIDGDAIVQGPRGEPVAASTDAPIPDDDAKRVRLPISVRGRGAPRAWLTGVRQAGLTAFDRLILQQTTTVVALELMRQRAMRDSERRLAGDVLAEAIGGKLDERDLAARLRPFAIGEEAIVMVFSCPDPVAAERDLEALLAEMDAAALVATREQLLCAVVDAGTEGDLTELTRALRRSLEHSHGPVSAAVSRVARTGAVRNSFTEARCALEAAALQAGDPPEVATYADLGAFQLLLSLQDDEALSLYCESVLAPLRESGGEYGDELLRSVETFIECNGQWERAAKELFCHRHTLRYRINRVEELTGRDLSNARDRVEIWLALRARELVA
ncbi:MAG TPA: PucR family transcriptional regulator ligand-binding domain-containing protein [Baekduia sp.]|nr:PucR family transcriptional regulator ligand-binding domain-containing protein [Baekduia sp.]